MFVLDCDLELIYIKFDNEKIICIFLVFKVLNGFVIIEFKLSKDSCIVDFNNSLSVSCDFFAVEFNIGLYIMIVFNSGEFVGFIMSLIDLIFFLLENNFLEDNVEVRDIKD